MNLARVSTNGQITIPAEIRRALNIKSGDKIMFLQNEKGDIIVQTLNVPSIRKPMTEESNQATG